MRIYKISKLRLQYLALETKQNVSMPSSARFNDFAPEMLASARRGPFAEPTASERIEYLVTRLRSERTRLDHENYALEHVLSYQRRIAATKDAFMKRNTLTPLGILNDWWDRSML